MLLLFSLFFYSLSGSREIHSLIRNNLNPHLSITKDSAAHDLHNTVKTSSRRFVVVKEIPAKEDEIHLFGF